MPHIPGFSDNLFDSRSGLVHAAVTLLKPLHAYRSPRNARIKLATGTGAGFSETAAQLEGFARPLWVVADLLRLELEPLHEDGQLSTWLEGLKAGVDPGSEEYWGDLSDFDQRMVEMESIAYAILTAPEMFGFPDDEKARANLVAWLRQINEHKMPQTNWLWFRVLVNLALVRVLKVPVDEVKPHIDRSLEVLDTFYLGEGWNSDGLWCDEHKQADYYSGSFAIQFAQLLFVRFASDYHPGRIKRYKQQAAEFASTFWRYFSKNGAAIPFGRSLTYRFAFAAFWSAASIAGVELPGPVKEPGVVKGLITRHLRWWAKHEAIFNTDATLNTGYAYPNMFLAENYTSPQSVYWCLKTFVVLALPEHDEFWQCKELAYPEICPEGDLERLRLLKPPMHIMCNTAEHHFLLSSGQSTKKRFRAREAKYSKFAYSSAFGFSVPCGLYLEQMAPDSTLSVRRSRRGDDEWKVRFNPYDVVYQDIQIGEETIPTILSSWKPWKEHEASIRTTLIPPMAKWPGWHVRVHRIYSPDEEVEFFDAGFAISAQTRDDRSIFERPIAMLSSDGEAVRRTEEGWWTDDSGCTLVISEAGASGVFSMRNGGLNGKAMVIRADPNTNLMAQRTLLPAVTGVFKPSTVAKYSLAVTAIFAVASPIDNIDVWALWRNAPNFDDILSAVG
ncbi:hypothetical protein CB0940_00028 [Cercospora beticola]|uniref:DUF2264 domain-containing protein n=1 Tax=Cercospora beticola TaxID=122368 RepID=A0A2G5IAS9_CERBT|nr:hypothetical protein CB0940_00028 [Cercospora beticola]PIB01905.1 hypothetical protein CB0940_00028 [Cercospora beticola]WPA95429.1 hypothetical protein RHO25_000028 [Cercospora beticola]